jgi:hypothetical protein
MLSGSESGSVSELAFYGFDHDTDTDPDGFWFRLFSEAVPHAWGVLMAYENCNECGNQCSRGRSRGRYRNRLFLTSTPIPVVTPKVSDLCYFRNSYSRAFGAPMPHEKTIAQSRDRQGADPLADARGSVRASIFGAENLVAIPKSDMDYFQNPDAFGL